jgi:hypothetical protein
MENQYSKIIWVHPRPRSSTGIPDGHDPTIPPHDMFMENKILTWDAMLKRTNYIVMVNHPFLTRRNIYFASKRNKDESLIDHCERVQGLRRDADMKDLSEDEYIIHNSLANAPPVFLTKKACGWRKEPDQEMDQVQGPGG